MKTVPLNFRAEDRVCLLVGGGNIALQKAEVLTAGGMAVRVVAPWVMEKIEALPGVTVIRREFQESDLDGVAFAISATDNPELNHRVYNLSRRRGLPANCVDDPDYCDFIFPSILRRGELAVSVSTGGGSPALARMLREWLEGKIDGEYGVTLELVGEMRAQARRRIGCPGARRAINETNARMALKALETKTPDLRARMEAAIALAAAPAPIATQLNVDPAAIGDVRAEETVQRGSITLVGAGPGDPELLTLAGARALAEADLVVYDRLVNPALLDHARGAEKIYVGKQPGEPHEATQGRINELIVAQARAGRRVVRLKGGDSFIFGRGGEEVLAARREGIDVRVIPGITAAIGAAAAMQLPLTHRMISHGVAFITGCPAAEAPEPSVDWRAMARAIDTLVLYMGVRHVAKIAGELIAGGRPADQPAAAIERATTPEQKIHHFTLAELARGAAEGPVAAPAVFIVGEVVRLQSDLANLAADCIASCSRP